MKMEFQKLLEEKKKKKTQTNYEINLRRNKYELFAVLEYTAQAGRWHFTTPL